MSAAMDRHFGEAIQADATLQYIPRAALEKYFRRMAWLLFDEFKDQKILSVKKWFVSITITVDHLRPFLEKAIGPRPITSTSW